LGVEYSARATLQHHQAKPRNTKEQNYTQESTKAAPEDLKSEWYLNNYTNNKRDCYHSPNISRTEPWHTEVHLHQPSNSTSVFSKEHIFCFFPVAPF
jgi:hypothetical protein